MTRVVVTGGAGFLGSHLCQRLLADGCEVLALDNFLTGSPANVEHLLHHDGFRLLKRDVTEYLHVPGPVDQVLHFASPASPIDYLELPIETMKVGSIGTLHALGLAKEKGARFLLASTSETYGDPQVHPQPETYWGHVNPVGPRGVYDEAKRFSRGAHHGVPPHARRRHRHRADLQHARPAHAPATTAARSPPSPARRCTGQPITVAGDGSQTRSIIYVDDLITGILQAAAQRPRRAGEHRQPARDLGAAPRRDDQAAGRQRVARSSSCRGPTDDPTIRQPDITVARTELGWEPEIGYEQGLERTIEWFRTHPELIR